MKRHPRFGMVMAALLLAMVSISVVVYLLPGARAQSEPTRKTREKTVDFVPGELLVRFRPGTGLAGTKTRTLMNISASGGRNLRLDLNHFGGSEMIEGLRLVRVAADDTFEAIKALRARTDVVYAEPNFIRYPDLAPNDPRYPDLWGLKNGSFSEGGISAETAWNTTTGDHNVVVGVVDSGIDIEHRDLKDNIFVNTGEIPNNGIDDDNNGFTDDVNGWDFIHNDKIVFDSANEDFHGTHVAGTIGARGNNAAGVVGVNWDVQILPLKAIGPQGSPDSIIVEAFTYARKLRERGVNLRVLNNSYGSQQFSQTMLEAIRLLNDAGILFVAAAGNITTNNDFISHFPANFDVPNVISVAASNRFGSLAFDFSNQGPQTVHLAAPGEEILSTTPRGYNGIGLVAAYTEADGSTYSEFDGTSMASPHVAGAAALAIAANPGISLSKLRASVLSGVDDGGVFTNLVITGGRLNANKTVQAALENDATSPATPGNFRINSQTGRRVELRWTEAGDDGTTGRASLDEIRFIDSVSNEQFRINYSRTENPGVERTVFVSVPLRHTSGQLTLRTSDNAGNTSFATVDVTVAADVADPYTVTLGPPGTLTAPNSGQVVGPKGDDVLSNTIQLPFPFLYYGFVTTSVVASSNGALYVPIPPDFSLPVPRLGSADFALVTEPNLEGFAMIAGMWTDIRTDRDGLHNVYMVQPDPDRVIFRWQGVTFGSETPVNFEIELRQDGTIQTRYGSGNQNLKPVIVGISGGDPDAYLISSHSSVTDSLSLTNAQTVTFALKNPPPPPKTDLSVSMTVNPNPALSGQNVTYNVRVTNLGTHNATDLVMTDVLPAGTTFVSCTTDHFVFGTCTASGSTVTGRINTLQPTPFDSGIGFTIVAKVDAAPGAVLQNTASATSFRPDPDPTNNSASVTSHVVAETFFTGARAIAAGNSHTSSVKTDGTVWTWGTGSQGQLGDGNSGIGVRSLTPLQVPGLTGFSSVEEGNGFVHAVKADGTVWGWGSNGNAQLGDGTSEFIRTLPVQAVGLTNVKAVSSGDFYAAAVKTDGTVWVWGAPSGVFSNESVLTKTPTQLDGITNVSAIAAGGHHLLMLKNDKTVWALGVNSMGQLGDGTTTQRLTPVQVNGLSNVKNIGAGAEFSVALKEDGTIWAWGLNRNGQLGPGGGSMNFDPHPNPVQVTGLPAGMSNLSAGQEFCLALAGDGTVWSWGNNSSGQLGQGPQIIQVPTPGQIPNFGNVSAIAGGNFHSVALKTDGSVWAWGGNLEGEIGDGTSNVTRFVPVRVNGLETVNTPLFNPPSGSFTTAVDVTITCFTPGATIHYTTNGNEPTESDPVVASGGTVRLTTFTFLRARAWKPGLIPSSAAFGQFDVSQLPPNILLDSSGPELNQAAALDSVTLLRDPFAVVNGGNHVKNPNDPNTRVILFVQNVQLGQGETAASVSILLNHSSSTSFTIPAEEVRPLAGFDFAQVTFRLPNNLAPGTAQVQIAFRNQFSNMVAFRIKP